MGAGATDRVRWPGLDGLRGLAAIVVVLFHAQLGFAVNGYVGVDVFFALSGFLITSILLTEIARHRTVRLRRFYVRRLLRLYPALVATCLLVAVVGVVGGNVSDTIPGVGAALLYVANWWQGLDRPMLFLEHTWTLAIEEHFYIAWPLLLIGLTSRRRWAQALAGLISVALLVALFTPWPEPITPVRGTYLRGFAIVWGSLLAVVWHYRREWLRARLVGAAGTLAGVALTAVLLIPWVLPEAWLTGPNSITGVLALMVVAGCVAAPRSLGARWLSWGPLTWAGRRSYGLYLYHFPILSILRHHVDVGPLEARMAIGIAVSVLVSWASFKWWETPFLDMKDRRSREVEGDLLDSHPLRSALPDGRPLAGPVQNTEGAGLVDGGRPAP